jgi:hypothetical protein
MTFAVSSPDLCAVTGRRALSGVVAMPTLSTNRTATPNHHYHSCAFRGMSEIFDGFSKGKP